MKYSPSQRGFFSGSIEYSALPSDLIDVPDEYHAALMAAQSAGAEIVPDQSGIPQAIMPATLSAEEALAVWRTSARQDRGPLCLALHAAGILSAASALEASKGNWPSEFAEFLASMSAQEQLAAQIGWADATVVRYQNPLLQSAALAYAGGDAAAATAILDAIFGAP